MSLGFTEVVILLAIVLVIFGAGKLPTVMGDLAKGVRNFKAGLKEDEPVGAPASAAAASAQAPAVRPHQHQLAAAEPTAAREAAAAVSDPRDGAARP